MAARGLRGLPCCFRLAFVVVVVAVISPGLGAGPRMQPFFDPARTASNCSWSWDSPTPGDQFCKRTFVEKHSICPDGFGRPASVSDRPPKAADFQVSDFEQVFTSLEPGANGQYTCLNITYTIPERAAEKVIGLQVSVRGMNQPDQALLYCLSKNFTGLGLYPYAVRNRVFADQCFCGIKPGRIYQVDVRTLPTDDNMDDPYDSNVRTDYTADGCHVSNKSNNVRCQNSEEARWEPECIIIRQLMQTGDYDSVVVWFDTAPAGYNFDRYQVFVYRYSNGLPTGLVDNRDIRVTTTPEVIVNRTCPMSLQPHEACEVVFDSKSWADNLDGATFLVTVKPFPSVNQCLDAELWPTSCTTSKSSAFSVITDPCIGNPCSPGDGETVGNCTSQEERYSCSCVDGYRVWKEQCIADPCKFLASNGSWVTQCANGMCTYTPDQTDFYCYCNDGYILVESKQCIADPCAVDAATNLTVCGQHGDCVLNLTGLLVAHTCDCQQGYQVGEGQQACKAIGPAAGLIVGATLGSCALGLLLFLLLFCLFRHHENLWKIPSETIPPMPVEREFPNQDPLQEFVPVPGQRRVLPIYSDDHPQHQEVVQCFCRLLRQHGGCEVALIDWQKSVGPSVEMWLSAEMDQADLVLLLCSKGTGVKYKARARLRTPATSPGVYGDVYVKSLALLDDYLLRNDAQEKFAVAYFDYSDEADIPVTFRRLGRYKLMQQMEPLFLKIHGLGRASPHSTRRVSAFKEAQYTSLEMGPPLYRAIEDMKAMVKSDAKWYERHNSGDGQTAPLSSLDPQISVDSAYDSADMVRAPQGFFSDAVSISSSNGSTGSDFEKSLQQFQAFPSAGASGPPLRPPLVPDQPQTRLLSEDIHMNVNADAANPFLPGSFYSDIQLADFLHQGQVRPGSSV